MARPPRLTTDGEDRLKVKASLPGGRYHFTLRERTKTLLRDDLAYEEGEDVPWELFKVLVLAEEANFPNVQDGIELAEDLIEPSSNRPPTDEEALALADHLEGTRLTDRQRAALESTLADAGLDEYVDVEKIPDAGERVEELRQIGAEAEAETGERGPDEDATPGDDGTMDVEEETGQTAEATAPDSAAGGGIDDPFVQNMMLLAERLVRIDPDAIETLPTDDLVDLYTLLSEVQSTGDDLRTAARDVLVERIEDDGEIEGGFGTIERKTRRRRSLRAEHEVFERLAEAGVDHTDVLSVELDRSKLQAIAEEHDIPEEDLFDVAESAYVRRVGSDDGKKREAFERIARGE